MTGSPLKPLPAIPRTVWTLGFISMFMDISSEMIHSLLPVFLMGTLGASAALVGFIEGAGEATAAITKVFSGWLSDRLGKRKILLLAGYGLGALSKPVFPLSVTPFEVLGARFADRIGKGIRGAPRDAMVADVTPKEIRGAAYGLRQALDTVGAFLGPLAAIALMYVLAGDMRAVFWWAVIPGAIAVLLIIAGLEETRHDGVGPARKPVIMWNDISQFSTAYWSVVLIGVLFTMARFSEAFLVLRAQDTGFEVALLPLVMVVMNLVYAAVSTPAGRMSDRMDRRLVLGIGLVVLIMADLILAASDTVMGVFVGVTLWGLHMGLTQGLLSALVADTAPASLRGTAFGIFNLAAGVALLLASSLAGVLWASLGPYSTFLAGAVFAALSLAGLVAMMRMHGVSPPAQ